jgi:hypothetical protein
VTAEPGPATSAGSRRGAATDLRKPPRRFRDWEIAVFRCAHWCTTRVWPGRRLYLRAMRRGALELMEVDVPVPGLPPGLDGLRLVQLSDLHAGDVFDESTLLPAVELARACRPHLVLLTGDFVTHAAEEVLRLGHALGRIQPSCGAFAVFGNHDYRGRREGRIAAWLRRQGVTVLRNENVVLSDPTWGGARLAVAGLEDIEESKGSHLEPTVAGLSPPDVAAGQHARLLLCHNPDVVERLPPGLFHLVASGHSHGGQIVLPLVGTPGRPWMPRHVRGSHPLPGGGLLHVNRGLGILVLPFRLGARPELTLFTLRAEG